MSFLPATLCSFLVIFGQTLKIPEGLRQWDQLGLNFHWWLPLSLKSLSIGIGVGSFILITLAFIAYSSSLPWLRKYLQGYTLPSAALTGCVFYILAMDQWTEFKLIVGISLISLPFCYKLLIDSVLSSLLGQVQVARTMGASHFMIFRNIIWPQVSAPCGLAAGLGALWSCGDFAFSSIVSDNEITLALKIKNLLNSYRLELSILLSWLMLICGSFLFLFFGRLGRVLSRTSTY